MQYLKPALNLLTKPVCGSIREAVKNYGEDGGDYYHPNPTILLTQSSMTE